MKRKKKKNNKKAPGGAFLKLWETSKYFLLLGAVGICFFWVWQAALLREEINFAILKVKKSSPLSLSQNLKERLVDGVWVEKGQENLAPVAVVVENAVDARPLAGLEKASLVIEAPVEGGITRYLLLFAGEEAAKIGPVRSARPYFIDWAEELRALFAHVGGSPEALRTIKARNGQGIFDLDQYFWSQYYWRTPRRPRPHNVYTSTQLLRKAQERRGLKQGKFSPWLFKDDNPSGEGVGLVCDFSFPQYKVEWRYNSQDNFYYRYLAGKPHLAESGAEIKAKNVVFLETSIVSLDAEDRKKIKTTGSGLANIFLDCRVIQGRWQRKSLSTRTRFYQEDGEEIAFNRGPIWIEVGEKGVCKIE